MKVTKEFYTNLPDFDTYYQYITTLFEEGKTTGANQSEAMLNYTKLSLTRTKRGLKTFKLTSELIEKAKKHPSKNWMIITEAWCGDAGNIIPIIKLLADKVGGINLKAMLRDEHPQIMENYLTDGGKSIPIFVLFDNDLNEIKRWGPRPKPLQKMIKKHRIDPKLSHEELSIEIQKWYVKDKTQTLQKELIDLFS